jgi:ABC-2 type transport system permease protein
MTSVISAFGRLDSSTGAGALARLALRLDRVRLTGWVLGLSILPLLTAQQYQELYPTNEDIVQVEGVLTNPSLVAMNGPLFSPTLGGLTAWKITATLLILVGLMSLFTVVRHTRTEEETGRLELLGSTVTGRYAPLTAALAVVGLANVAIAVLTAIGLIGVGLPASGAVALGAGIGVMGLLFAAVAAVASQVTAGARAATGASVAVLGASYLLRAIGDTGPTWLTWLSPLGWSINLRPFSGERWWVLALPIGLTATLTATAYLLNSRRDLGAGLVKDRRGPARAPAYLSGTLGLAWRHHWGMLLGWAIGLALWGAALGGAADGIRTALTANGPFEEVLARLGGHKALVDAYLAAVFGITGLVVAAYTTQATLRLRAEEVSGRLEPILATGVRRIAWALSHLAFAILGTAGLLAVTGVSAGLAYGSRIHDVAGQVPRLLGAAMVQTPAALVLAGLGMALYGLTPRLSSLTWVGLIGCFVLLELGALLGLDQRLVNASPFAHVPKLPGSAVTATPLLWLTGVGLLGIVAGLAGLRRRDIG